MAGKKPTYFELLQHPQWQKKRLEVLSLAGFVCEVCDSGEKMLHVHHAYYEKGLKPWEYPIASLHCLCVDCHRKAQDSMTLLHRQIGKLGMGDTEQLIGYALGLEAADLPMAPIDVFSYEVAQGVADVWHITAEQVIAAIKDGVIDGYTLKELKDSVKRTKK